MVSFVARSLLLGGGGAFWRKVMRTNKKTNSVKEEEKRGVEGEPLDGWRIGWGEVGGEEVLRLRGWVGTSRLSRAFLSSCHMEREEEARKCRVWSKWAMLRKGSLSVMWAAG